MLALPPCMGSFVVLWFLAEEIVGVPLKPDGLSFSFLPYQLQAQQWQHKRAANDMRTDVEGGGMRFRCHYLYVKQICLWPHPFSILITFWL